MDPKPAAPKTIDEYIARFPMDVQQILQEIRRTIRQAAPQAQETIKYQIPTFTLKGNLVHFGAYKRHIGFYPPPGATGSFKDELAIYAGEKGNLKFPLDKPMPLDLIRRIVLLRVKENLEKAETKSRKYVINK
jgi:uncharacterized protein YdhG (YjbR/CyaY superfamily)